MPGIPVDYDAPFDGAVVGGGCAGLSCGWRLRDSKAGDYWTLRPGMESLPKALSERFMWNGGLLLLHQRVASVRRVILAIPKEAAKSIHGAFNLFPSFEEPRERTGRQGVAAWPACWMRHIPVTCSCMTLVTDDIR